MIKSFAALAIFAILGASVIVVPVFALPAEAVAMPKADRLPLHSAAGACSSQVWPNFDASCLHNGGSGAPVREARLIVGR
jgi:hypothetical protein